MIFLFFFSFFNLKQTQDEYLIHITTHYRSTEKAFLSTDFFFFFLNSKQTQDEYLIHNFEWHFYLLDQLYLETGRCVVIMCITHTHTHTHTHTQTHTILYIYICMYMYICTYIYIYIYMYIYIERKVFPVVCSNCVFKRCFYLVFLSA